MLFKSLFSNSLRLIRVNQNNILKNLYKTTNYNLTLNSSKINKENVFKTNLEQVIGLDVNSKYDLLLINSLIDNKILKKKINFIKKKFNSSEEEIKVYFKDYPSLYYIEENLIEELIDVLIKDLNVTKDDIFNHLWVLLFEKKFILHNIEILKNSSNYSSLDSSDKLKLVIFCSKHLEKFLKIKKSFSPLKTFSKKMKYFEEKFNCLPQQSLNLLHRNPAIVFRRSKSIEQMTNFLINDCKIDPKKIIKDIWIYNNGFENTKLRAKRLLKINYPIEIWLLRCQDEPYDKRMSLFSKEKNILNNLSKEDYFKNLLKCDDEDLKKIRVDYFRTHRLDNIIKFYLNNGLTEQQILDHPKMLFFSIKTAKERIDVLKKHLIPDELINALTFSKKQFKNRIISYEKQNNLEVL